MDNLPLIQIPMPEEEPRLFKTGTSLTQNWDKNGRIFYTDENGDVVRPRVNPLTQFGNKLKAFGINAKNWINDEDPDSEAYKQKMLVTAGLLAAPLGLGEAGTAALGARLTPFLGSKIGQMTAQGIGSGLVGGGVEGVTRGLIYGENPIKTGLQDAGLGMLLGGGIGLSSGKLLRTIDKFNNPWFVDEGLQNGDNVLSYMYDRIIPKNNTRLSKLETPEAIRKIRTAGSGHNDGIGVYTKRSYPNANAGVVATYYPTDSLTKTSKIQGWETPKFNELTPNNNETAQLYYDTLKGVKDKFGKAYDTVSLHPVEEYKNMRLFLSPDKANGFAIQPDGDIVSVFGAKPGSGTSHSMLELALQNKGYKLDNYDVSRLRNLYDNHGFNVTEKMKWNDEFWDPKEWDKSFMQKEYGVAEPDITFREIYDKNIYPEIQSTSLFEKLIDAIK